MYIYYLILTIFLIKNYIYLSTMFQQNHYDYKKYIKTLKKYYLYKPYQYKYYLSIIFIILSLITKYFIMFACISLILSFIFKNKYIIKLRYTKRIKRLIITNIIIYILCLILFHKNIYIISLYPLILPFILILSNIINKPLEQLIKRYSKAKEVLDIGEAFYYRERKVIQEELGLRKEKPSYKSLFTENPDITYEQFKEKFNVTKCTFYRQRRKYLKK